MRARPRVELVHLGLAALRALAAGDLAAAREASGLPVTAWLAGPECVGTWRIRAAQVAAEPVAAGWVTAVVLDADRRAVVGKAGYHGPPDEAGMVEVGYAVDPALRRRGYARAALEHLLTRAAREPGVRTVRASIRPDNLPSRNLVLGHGFVEVGRQWDEEDGWETVYEVAARPSSAAARRPSVEMAARPPSSVGSAGRPPRSESAVRRPGPPGP